MPENDFSGVPALGDTEGLENYLNQQSLQAAGISQATTKEVTETPIAQPAQPVQTAQPTIQSLANQSVSQEDLAAITARVNEINAKLDAQAQQRVAQAPQQRTSAAYTAQETQFIQAALAQGYSLNDINRVIMERRGVGNPQQQQQQAMAQRMEQIENYLRTQEYQRAETEFINKLTDFGNKWGLSEQDLVTFGNTALDQFGINIAQVKDLEAAFRAVYPEQYQIRLQRMTPNQSSQIYGGTAIPEGTRAQAARAEDAYVEAFLKSHMPNYDAFNKK